MTGLGLVLTAQQLDSVVAGFDMDGARWPRAALPLRSTHCAPPRSYIYTHPAFMYI
jgi:hypothetical protein